MSTRRCLFSAMICILMSTGSLSVTTGNNAMEMYLPWKAKHIIPVLHNLESFMVPAMIDALDGIKCCTVSLRHASALSSLKDLTEEFGPYCDVGVSTVVSTNQVWLTLRSLLRRTFSDSSPAYIRKLLPCFFRLPFCSSSSSSQNTLQLLISLPLDIISSFIRL